MIADNDFPAYHTIEKIVRLELPLPLVDFERCVPILVTEFQTLLASRQRDRECIEGLVEIATTALSIYKQDALLCHHADEAHAALTAAAARLGE